MKTLQQYLERCRNAATNALRKVTQDLPAFMILGVLFLATTTAIILLVSAWPEHRIGYASLTASFLAICAFMLNIGKSGDDRSFWNLRGAFAYVGLLLGFGEMFLNAVEDPELAFLTVVQAGLILVLAKMTRMMLEGERPNLDIGIPISGKVSLWKRIFALSRPNGAIPLGRLSVSGQTVQLLLVIGILVAVSFGGAPIVLDVRSSSAAHWGYVLGAFALFTPF